MKPRERQQVVNGQDGMVRLGNAIDIPTAQKKLYRRSEMVARGGIYADGINDTIRYVSNGTDLFIIGDQNPLYQSEYKYGIHPLYFETGETLTFLPS